MLLPLSSPSDIFSTAGLLQLKDVQETQYLSLMLEVQMISGDNVQVKRGIQCIAFNSCEPLNVRDVRRDPSGR